MHAEGDGRLAAVEGYMPGVASLRTYERRWLRSDVVAGIVLAAILVPQGMAYAELAGVPPVNGLYTTIACLVGYALMGPSKILVLGPDSSLGPLIFAAITPLVVAGDDPATAVALAGMLAILVGLIEIGLGVGKLGFVADLLSSEVQVGYMNGLAIVIIVGQLPKLSGFSTDADTFVEEVREFVTNFDQRNATALGVGLVTLAVLLVLPRLTRAIPAVLVAVVGATVATAVFDLDIGTVGTLPEGLPTPEVPWTDIGDVASLLVAAVGITLVSLTDTIALSTSFNARRGERVRPNKEMIGIGSANIAAGFFRGFAISASSSRTAVAEQSGAKSQFTGIVGAGVVVLLLVFFNGLLADLPNSALAAVVIAAAISLADFSLLARVWRIRRSAVVLSLVASAGVIFLGVLEGIVVAVVLSILLFFQQNWWPHGEVLGRVPGRDGWHSDPGGRPRRNTPTWWCSAGRRHCSSPTPACSPTRYANWCRSAGRRGWCCNARRSPTSTSPPPQCSSGSTTSSTPKAYTSPSSSYAPACGTSSTTTDSSGPSTATTSTPRSRKPSPRSTRLSANRTPVAEWPDADVQDFRDAGRAP